MSRTPCRLSPAFRRAKTAKRQHLFGPCIPTRATKVPTDPNWLHEIKHDGYRLIVRRDGPTVRLFTRRGYDWTARYPLIAAAAARLAGVIGRAGR